MVIKHVLLAVAQSRSLPGAHLSHESHDESHHNWLCLVRKLWTNAEKFPTGRKCFHTGLKILAVKGLRWRDDSEQGFCKNLNMSAIYR